MALGPEKYKPAVLLAAILMTGLGGSFSVSDAFTQQPLKTITAPRPPVEGPVKNPTVPAPEQQTPSPQGMAPMRVDDNTFITKTCPELKKALVPLIRKFNDLKRREKGLFSEFTQKDREEFAQTKQALDEIRQQLRQRCQESPTQDPRKKQRR